MESQLKNLSIQHMQMYSVRFSNRTNSVCQTLIADESSVIEFNLKTCKRILYGRKSKREEVPWHVGLYYNDNRYNEFLSCGGTLISSLKIVTAAHCFGSSAANALKRKRSAKNSGSYKVNAGVYTINGYQYRFRTGYKLFIYSEVTH